MISTVFYIVGAWYYKNYLRDMEIRTIIMFGTAIATFGQFVTMMQAYRWNI